jgi:hypothetical protein
MAAGFACLTEVAQPGVHETLTELTNQLAQGLLDAARDAGIPLVVNNVGGMFGIFFTDAPTVTCYQDVVKCDVERFKRFFHLMLEEGVYLAPSAFEAGFMSIAHSEEDIDNTVAAARNAFAKLTSTPGPLPRQYASCLKASFCVGPRITRCKRDRLERLSSSRLVEPKIVGRQWAGKSRFSAETQPQGLLRMTTQSSPTPHDAIFKQLLAHIDTARDFIDIHLPADLRSLCDLNTLQLESGSFIEEDLRAYYSDVLYSLKSIIRRAISMCLLSIKAHRTSRCRFVSCAIASPPCSAIWKREIHISRWLFPFCFIRAKPRPTPSQ